MNVPGVTDELLALDQAGLRRDLRAVERIGGSLVRVDGREAVSFGSCDYLGLATDPRLTKRAAAAITTGGTSAGAARLLTGHSPDGSALEKELCATFHSEAALVFGAGYLANVGVITALAGGGDLILSDRLSHASTVDACRLSRAKVRVFDHNDVGSLAEKLADASSFRRVLILVEGLYSVDGDAAPLEEVVEVADRTGAAVVVDDAHGFGTQGPGGRGSAAAACVADRIAVQIGNLGKALGSYGAFVLASPELRDLFVQRARAFVFTCALPPAVVEAARAGLAVLREDDGPLRRLVANRDALSRALRQQNVPAIVGTGPILPVPIGDDARASAISAALLERGWLVPAVRPPTVPPGGARLRLTVTAAHTTAEIEGVAAVLAEVLPESRLNLRV